MEDEREGGSKAGIANAGLCDADDILGPIAGSTVHYGERAMSAEHPAVLMGKAKRIKCGNGHEVVAAIANPPERCSEKGCDYMFVRRAEPERCRPCGCGSRGRHRAGCPDVGKKSRKLPPLPRTCGCGHRGRHRKECPG